jgi:tetratricopeptide (TPR) repeat protein
MSDGIKSLLDQGYQARRDHRLAEGKSIYNEAVAQARQSGEPSLLVQSLTRLGGIERDLGEIESSLQRYREAVSICRSLDSPLTLAHTIRHVGDILRESAQLEAALPCYREALEIYRSHPETNMLDLANTLRGYALLEAALGQTETAIALWQETRALYNQVWQEPESPYSEADLKPGILESQRQIAQLSQVETRSFEDFKRFRAGASRIGAP